MNDKDKTLCGICGITKDKLLRTDLSFEFEEVDEEDGGGWFCLHCSGYITPKFEMADYQLKKKFVVLD